jgi:hypothetical protein
MRISRDQMAKWGSTDRQARLPDLIPERDYHGLNVQDVQLRIWLPDPAKIALMEICNRLGMSITAYLTELFATYLYGVHEVMRMRDQQTGLYSTDDLELLDTAFYESEPVEDDDPEFDESIPEMGKNIFALKIFLSSKLKNGLQMRADKAQAPLGKFARAMICAHLFGRDIGPKYLMAINEATQ